MAMEENPTVYPSYEAPTLTVDAVIFQLIGDRLHVLLIKRRRDPFAGAGALPGVYNPKGETTLQALSRALHAKAGIEGENLGLIRQLQVSDTVARDPRGHAVSVVYLGLGRNLQPTTAPNVEDPGFFPVDDLPELAFDHAEIIADAIMYLKTQIMDVNILAALLAEKFTLTQLQSAYETLLGQVLDKRNFRKKIAALQLIEATIEYYKEGAHRPARLYRFAPSAFATPTLAFT